MKQLILATAAFAMFTAALPTTAQETSQETAVLKPLSVITMTGAYAGTFLCSSGEMGMSLSIKDIGPTINSDGKSVDADKRLINGVLNFFPTVGNPEAPKGAFEVGGTAHSYNYFTKIKLEPGKWLEKPENFGASGLEGTIITNTGQFTGKPTVSGCHTLHMTKLRTK